MAKDYSEWHEIKSNIDTLEFRVLFQDREIWFCNLGLNVGFEQDGRGENYLRPVIVLKKFNNFMFFAVPLTKTVKSGKFYFPFVFKNDVTSTAILSQIRLLDAKRLRYKVGYVVKKDFEELKTKLKQLLE